MALRGAPRPWPGVLRGVVAPLGGAATYVTVRILRCCALRAAAAASAPGAWREDSYLVDSASSHMLVSKIKPCMSKYKQLYSETANGSLNQLSFI
jgi:hypothetical protein